MLLNLKEGKKFSLKRWEDFNLKEILECGQCFRWKEQEDGSYIGVIKDGVMQVQELGEEIVFDGNIKGNFEEVCMEYFDLKRDYYEIKEKISKNDEKMKKAIEAGKGIRILKQDSWEMLISFIISAANNIPRISKTIENISRQFGKRIIWKEKEYYLFPTPEELVKASREELRECNLGFRDSYVAKAAQMVVQKKILLESIEKMSYEEAKKYLMQIPGVGAKVADCILLFAYAKMEAFPVDTWIKKVMNELYFESSNITKLNQYARQKFGNYAGIAQQYLFYYKREER